MYVRRPYVCHGRRHTTLTAGMVDWFVEPLMLTLFWDFQVYYQWKVAYVFFRDILFNQIITFWVACRQLGFDVTGNSAIRSADPENPTPEPNMKCIGSPVAEIWPFAYLGGIWNHFGGRRGRRGWVMAPFERAMVVSYRLSIVTVALSVTNRPQFAIECLWRSINRGVTLGSNFRVFPLE